MTVLTSRRFSILPFLKQKQIAGLIISKRKPDGAGIIEEHSEGNEDEGLEACAEDLIKAIGMKDAKAAAKAMRAAFELMEMEPHEEAEHDESEDNDKEDFASQNEKAAKESK